MTFTYDKTAKLYQAGWGREQAIERGAHAAKFDALEIQFKGGSIPLHLVLGIPYEAPYSYDYHTGGAQGEMLWQSIAEHNKGKK